MHLKEHITYRTFCKKRIECQGICFTATLTGSITVPLGIWNPLYVSSWMTRWGMENGATGFHLNVSRRMARRKTRFSRSMGSGSLWVPTTVSSSTCAFLWISGFIAMASMKNSPAAVVYVLINKSLKFKKPISSPYQRQLKWTVRTKKSHAGRIQTSPA